MAKPLKFVRLQTDFRGLITRAVREFDRYLDQDRSQYHWACIEDPEHMAKALEFLSEDLPEEDLAEIVPRMPYLILLFHHADIDRYIPVEATLAFLSILNHSGLVTILRQTSDKKRIAPHFNLDPGEWFPVFFMVGGVPDLDLAFVKEKPSHCSFF